MRRGVFAPALVIAAALPATASAALEFQPCPTPKGVQCAQIEVPVDRTGGVPGVDKLALAGASYGTWVERAYAIRHPQHVERMVLDSTFGPNQNADPFAVEQFAAAPKLARALCHRHACRGITKDGYKDLLRLFARLQSKPVTTRVVRPDGKLQEVTLSPLAVGSLLPGLDVQGHLRAELPRAMAGALKGDPVPLARLVFAAPVGPPPEPRSAVNQTLSTATRCEEDVHPFDRTAAPADRLAQAHERLASIPAETFAPFGPDIAFLLSLVPTCAYWPMLPDQPSPGPGPPADVPVLLMRGEFDLRTTQESTDTVAAEFPQSKVLIIPNTGHSATRSELTRCARTAAATFLVKGTTPGPCKIAADPFAPRPLVPRSVRAAGGARAAVRMTVADAFDQLDAGSQGRTSAEPKVHGGGLRGGTFHGSRKGLVLVHYEFVKGFPVSGLVRPRGAVVLKARNRTLRFGPGGALVRRTIAASYPLTR